MQLFFFGVNFTPPSYFSFPQSEAGSPPSIVKTNLFFSSSSSSPSSSSPQPEGRFTLSSSILGLVFLF